MNTIESKERNFLINETKKQQAKEKRTWWIGLALATFVLCYMTYVSVQFKRIALNPSVLAHAFALQVDAAAPAAIERVRTDLKQQAPQHVSLVFDEIERWMPLIEKAGKLQVDTLFGLVPILEQESSGVIEHFFAINKDQIREFYNASQQEEFVEFFVDHVTSQLTNELNKDFVVEINGERVEGMNAVSLAHLRYINDEIVKLRGLHPLRMTPTQRLQRRTIVAWVNSLLPPDGSQSLQ